MKQYYYIILFLIIISFYSCNKKEYEIKISEIEALYIDSLKSVKKEIRASTADSLLRIKENAIIAPKGSQLFQNSVRLRGLLYGDGYILDSIIVEPCDEFVDDDRETKINNISKGKNTFIIDLSAIVNCCSEFLCEAEIKMNSNELNIIYHEFGRHCSCICQFDMKYYFSISEHLKEIGNRETPIKYVLINDYQSTRMKFK